MRVEAEIKHVFSRILQRRKKLQFKSKWLRNVCISIPFSVILPLFVAFITKCTLVLLTIQKSSDIGIK